MGYLVIDIFFIVVKNAQSSSQMMKMFLSQGMSYAFYYLFMSVVYWLWFSPIHDSPKKATAKEPSTPSKKVKNADRQLVFDKAAYVY